jgi:hypothetical protein
MVLAAIFGPSPSDFGYRDVLEEQTRNIWGISPDPTGVLHSRTYEHAQAEIGNRDFHIY